MKRRKRTSLRRWKRRFLLGKPIPMEAVVDTPRLELFITRRSFAVAVHGGYLVRASEP